MANLGSNKDSHIDRDLVAFDRLNWRLEVGLGLTGTFVRCNWCCHFR